MKKLTFSLIVALIALFGCEKVQTEQEPMTFAQLKELQNSGAEIEDAAIYEAVQRRLAELVAMAEQGTDADLKITGVDSTARIHLFAPNGVTPFTIAQMAVDTGIVELSAISCIIKAGGGLKFTGIMPDNVAGFINFANYTYASAVGADSSYVAFAAFSLSPQTIQHNPNFATKHKLFWVMTQGSGYTYFDKSKPENLDITSDGYNSYVTKTFDGTVIQL